MSGHDTKKTLSLPRERGALTYSVPEAGRLIGLSRNGAYEAAARGDIPTVRIGRKLFVPRAALNRLLEADGSPALTAPEAPARQAE
jgi:excisionase family DNA binding protein